MDDKQTPSTGGFHFVMRRIGRSIGPGISTRSPHGIQIIENCVACPHKESRLFADFKKNNLLQIPQGFKSEPQWKLQIRRFSLCFRTRLGYGT
jgi:hypothetical protein